MHKRKKAQVGNRVESHQMLADVLPSRIKEVAKRKTKPPKSTKIKCGWKKNTKEGLNDMLCFFETMLLQGVTKKRIETYTPFHKMNSIEMAMKHSEFHPCTSYGYNGNIFLVFEMLSDDMKKEDLTPRTLTLKLKTAASGIRSRAGALQRYISSSEDILKHATKLLKAELPMSVKLIRLRRSHFNGEIHNSDPSQGTIIKFIVQKDPSRQDLDDNDHSFDLDGSNDEGLSLSFGSHETSYTQLKDVYTGLIQHKRAWMMKRGFVNGKLAVNSTELRFAGLDLVMPEEFGIPLRVYGYSWDTIIFGARIWHHRFSAG